MGVRFRATAIAIGALLVLLLMQSVAKADGFTVTGETNGPVCSRSSVCSGDFHA